MKNFSYIGINSQGKSINGNLLSKNKKEALFILNKKGIIVEKLFSKSNYLTKFNIFSDGFDMCWLDLFVFIRFDLFVVGFICFSKN